MAISVGFLVLICLGLSGFLKALPPEFRLMEPGMVWLICIPCFNIVWIFFVYPRIARSYQNYFRAQDVTTWVIAAKRSASGTASAWCCPRFLCVGGIAAIASLILLIIYFVTLFGLRARCKPALRSRNGAPMQCLDDARSNSMHPELHPADRFNAELLENCASAGVEESMPAGLYTWSPSAGERLASFRRWERRGWGERRR